MFILVANKENRSLLRLINSYVTPGPKHKKIASNVILEKLGPYSLLFSDEKDSIRLLHWLKGRYSDEIRVFHVKDELQYKDFIGM